MMSNPIAVLENKAGSPKLLIDYRQGTPRQNALDHSLGCVRYGRLGFKPVNPD
jgi:hypothetical protein